MPPIVWCQVCGFPLDLGSGVHEVADDDPVIDVVAAKHREYEEARAVWDALMAVNT